MSRLRHMEEMLYDDKLAGDITKERYATKRADISKQIQELSDELLVADTTLVAKHHEAIDLIELSQSAYSQYNDSNLTNEARRTILSKLFSSVVYAHNSVSVTYSFLAKMIAQKSDESRQILSNQKVVNQTNKNDLVDGGHNVEEIQNSLLFPTWQGLQDDYQTYCDVTVYPKH